MIVVAIALQLLLAYGAFAISMIGLGLMIGGPPWAADAARLFLGRPLYALLRQLRALIAQAVSALVRVTRQLGHIVVTTLIDPFVRMLYWILDRLLPRRR